MEHPTFDVSLDDMVADGVRIALSGAQLALKNQVILDVARDGRDYDTSLLLVRARSVLDELVQQSKALAERAASRKLDPPAPTSGAPHHVHHAQLLLAPQVHRAIAAELAAIARDDGRTGELVRRARDAALDELRVEITRRLTTDYSPDPRYEQQRARRTKQVARDLAKLARGRALPPAAS